MGKYPGKKIPGQLPSKGSERDDSGRHLAQDERNRASEACAVSMIRLRFIFLGVPLDADCFPVSTRCFIEPFSNHNVPAKDCRSLIGGR
jgi:hypothetical protein